MYYLVQVLLICILYYMSLFCGNTLLYLYIFFFYKWVVKHFETNLVVWLMCIITNLSAYNEVRGYLSGYFDDHTTCSEPQTNNCVIIITINIIFYSW